MDSENSRSADSRQDHAAIFTEFLTEATRLFGSINTLVEVAHSYLGTKEGAELLDRGVALLLAIRKGAFLPESGAFNVPLLALLLGLGTQATKDRCATAQVPNYSIGRDNMHRADDLLRKGIEINAQEKLADKAKRKPRRT